MPLEVMERIVSFATNPGNVVVDPFSGTGTTCFAAARLGRRYIGIEKSENYAQKSRQRLAAASSLRPTR